MSWYYLLFKNLKCDPRISEINVLTKLASSRCLWSDFVTQWLLSGHYHSEVAINIREPARIEKNHHNISWENNFVYILYDELPLPLEYFSLLLFIRIRFPVCFIRRDFTRSFPGSRSLTIVNITIIKILFLVFLFTVTIWRCFNNHSQLAHKRRQQIYKLKQ